MPATQRLPLLLKFTAICGKSQYNKLRYAIMPLGGVRCLYPRIRDLREDHDMKQREVAAFLNCSQQVYSNYELGQRDIPTDVLIKLSSLYQVSVDFLLGITNNPRRY
jgi:DNA-binding XRE family transcriptional regulator